MGILTVTYVSFNSSFIFKCSSLEVMSVGVAQVLFKLMHRINSSGGISWVIPALKQKLF